MSGEKENRRSSFFFQLERYFSRGSWHPSAPVPVRSSLFEQRRLPPAYRETLWARSSAWLRYYAIQWRWDIERALARVLHRRWR